MFRSQYIFRTIWILLCGTSLAAHLPAQGQEGSASSEAVAALVKKSLDDMVFVEGGTFLMGDFGVLASPEKLPYTSQSFNKPVHEVTLDSFSIGRYKVTYDDFDVYTAATGKPAWPQDEIHIEYKFSKHPVGVPWQMAKDYCQWLGQQSGLPIDLLTKAQWEYAARSRGEFLIFSTDNGKWEPDRNLPSAKMVMEKLAPSLRNDITGVYPIGQFPPTPLGLYDMGLNGRDWVSDWFGADYYEHSPKKNPQGPATGTEKVIRGVEGISNRDTALTMYRYQWQPDSPYFVVTTIRCAVQSPINIPQSK